MRNYALPEGYQRQQEDVKIVCRCSWTELKQESAIENPCKQSAAGSDVWGNMAVMDVPKWSSFSFQWHWPISDRSTVTTTVLLPLLLCVYSSDPQADIIIPQIYTAYLIMAGPIKCMKKAIAVPSK